MHIQHQARTLRQSLVNSILIVGQITYQKTIPQIGHFQGMEETFHRHVRHIRLQLSETVLSQYSRGKF